MAERKKYTTAEKLNKVESDIATMEEQLKKLKSQRKELVAQKVQEDLKELRKLILDSGKSIEDVKAMLS